MNKLQVGGVVALVVVVFVLGVATYLLTYPGTIQYIQSLLGQDQQQDPYFGLEGIVEYGEPATEWVQNPEPVPVTQRIQPVSVTKNAMNLRQEYSYLMVGVLIEDPIMAQVYQEIEGELNRNRAQNQVEPVFVPEEPVVERIPQDPNAPPVPTNTALPVWFQNAFVLQKTLAFITDDGYKLAVDFSGVAPNQTSPLEAYLYRSVELRGSVAHSSYEKSDGTRASHTTLYVREMRALE